jgi:preprotein translocase subunit SecD
MPILRLVGIWWVTAMLWACPWNAPHVGAQSPSKHKWCLSFHEAHPSLTAAEARQKGVPAGYRIYRAPDGVPWEQELLLREEPLLHGGDVADAQPGISESTNSPIIKFRFHEAGASKFASFTRDNVGRPFAIVVDGRVVTAPIINEAILGGEAQISGDFTSDTAAQLADQIRSNRCAEG